MKTSSLHKMLVLSICLLTACGGIYDSTSGSSGGSGGGSGSSGGGNSGSSGATRGVTGDVASISSELKLATQTSAVQTLTSTEQAKVGQVAATGLKSLKYYITSITICEGMTTTGTAYSNPSGCLELYKGNQSDSNYTYTLDQDFAPFGDVARKSDSGFVDLMDTTSRANLNSSTTLTAGHVRSYNYGYISWYLPVKMKAEVTMSDGVVYRTLDGTTSSGLITTASGDFTTATAAEEAVVVLGNGGSWFRFQNPFQITQADIDAKTQFTLDLTFNPEGLIKGYAAGVGGCGACILKDKAGNQLLVPLLGLTPVPHKSSQSVVKESYLATVQSGADNFDIRLELYTIDGDTTKTIYGVDAATLVNANTVTAVSPFPKVAFIETGSNGPLELDDYRGTSGPLLTGFTRQSVVGYKTTAVLHCSDPSTGGFAIDGCSGTTKEVTFTLQSSADLQ